jgi:hypothetical protein
MTGSEEFYRSVLEEACNSDLAPRALVRLFLSFTGQELAKSDRSVERTPEQSADRERAVRDFLLGRRPQPPRLSAPDDLALLLRAIDEHLAVDRSGLPPIQIPVDVDGARFFVHQRLGGWRPRTAFQKASVTAWLRNFWIVPGVVDGYRVEFARSTAALKQRIRQIFERCCVCLCAGAIDDDVSTEWDAAAGLSPGLSNDGLRRQTIEQTLAQADGAGVDILALPELTSSAGIERSTQEWLRHHFRKHGFSLCLPGTRHVRETDGRCYNQGALLDPTGHVLLEQRKLRAYGPAHADVEAPGAPNERIDPGEIIWLLATPIGLVATPICRDFCDAGALKIWSTLGVEWLLVPAMGDGTTHHANERQASQLAAERGSVVLVALQPPPGRPFDTVHGGHVFGGPKSMGIEPIPAAQLDQLRSPALGRFRWRN